MTLVPLVVRTDYNDMLDVVGQERLSATSRAPHAESLVHFVMAIRGMLLGRNPLTLIVMSVLVMLIAQIVVVAVFTARGMGDSSIIWDAGDQLRQRFFSSLYTGISALLLSFVFFALSPFFGFSSAVATRFARHI